MTDDYSDDKQKETEIKAAIERYEEMLRRNKRYFFDQELLVQIIEHYDLADEGDKAMEVVDYAIELYPFSSELLMKKAQLLTDLGKYDAALKLLDKAASLAPTDTNIRLLRSDVLMLQNKYQDAVDELKEGLPYVAEDADNYYMEIADIYFEWEHTQEAFEYLKKAIEINPNNEFALNRLWYLVDVTGNYEESIEFHKAFLAENPFSYTAWMNLSQAYYGVSLYEKALDCCEYALAINAGIDTAYRDAGEILILLKRFQEALEYLLKVQNLHIPDPYLYYNIGFCYEKLKDFNKAKGFYLRSTQINKNFAEGYLQLGELYAKTKEWQKSIPYYRSAVKINEDYLPYKAKLAKALLKAEQFGEAQRLFLELLTHQTKKKNWWIGLISACLHQNQMQEASDAVEMARNAMGNLPEWRWANALIQYMDNQPKAAELEMEIAYAEQSSSMKVLWEYLPEAKDDQALKILLKKIKSDKLD
jgi:tetratricopeptide (TPR) repeat protein